MSDKDIILRLDRDKAEHLFGRCTESTNAPKVNGYSCEDCREIGEMIRAAIVEGDQGIEAAILDAGVLGFQCGQEHFADRLRADAAVDAAESAIAAGTLERRSDRDLALSAIEAALAASPGETP